MATETAVPPRCWGVKGGYDLSAGFEPVERCSHLARVQIACPEIGIRYLACETHSMDIREAIGLGASGWTISDL